MKIDFHFYTIYALCLSAGINEEDSKKIAYSSQHVDDAKYGHELTFKNGGRFKQRMSAHKFLDPGVLSKEVGYDIFLPFHFLPGGNGDEFYDKLVCKQNSEIANKMLEDTIKTLKRPYGLHRLGVSLHVYADTWSHQNFIGLQHQQNEVSDLDLLNTDDYSFTENFSGCLPQIGHGEANIFPDIPYLKWSYEDNQNNELEINNLERTINAAERIYKFLTSEVFDNRNDIFNISPKEWSSIRNNFMKMFKLENGIDEKVELWEEKLKEGYFGYESEITYDDREWFKKAVKVRNIHSNEIYERKTEFHKSNWKYFHDALNYHSFYVKHELLPQYGIIT